VVSALAGSLALLVPLACDASSDILSRPIDVGAQIAPAEIAAAPPGAFLFSSTQTRAPFSAAAIAAAKPDIPAPAITTSMVGTGIFRFSFQITR